MWTINELVAVFDGSAITDAEEHKMQTEDAYEATIRVLQTADFARAGDPVRAKRIIRHSLALLDFLSPALDAANANLLAAQKRVQDVHALQEHLLHLYVQVIAGVNIHPQYVHPSIPGRLVRTARKSKAGGVKVITRGMKSVPMVLEFDEARRRVGRKTLCELAEEGVHDFPCMSRLRKTLSAERFRGNTSGIAYISSGGRGMAGI